MTYTHHCFLLLLLVLKRKLALWQVRLQPAGTIASKPVPHYTGLRPPAAPFQLTGEEESDQTKLLLTPMTC